MMEANITFYLIYCKRTDWTTWWLADCPSSWLTDRVFVWSFWDSNLRNLPAILSLAAKLQLQQSSCFIYIEHKYCVAKYCIILQTFVVLCKRHYTGSKNQIFRRPSFCYQRQEFWRNIFFIFHDVVWLKMYPDKWKEVSAGQFHLDCR
jgi:hypothetical protein